MIDPLDLYSFVHHGVTYSTDRSAHGTYICPCPTHRGIDQEYSLDDLNNHVGSWKAVYDAQYPPHQESLRRISTELCDTSTLRSLGLCINQRFSFLICIQCAVVLIPSQGASHLAQKHSMKCADLGRIIAPFSLGSSIPAQRSGAIPPIEGLAVVDAFKCTDCGYILSTTRHLNTHFSEQHPRNTHPDRYLPVSAQHLNNFSSRTYFEVSPSVSTAGPLTIDDYIANVTGDINRVYSAVQVKPDARNVPSWLKITGWHEHLANLPPKNIRRLVSFPTVNEFPTLKKYVSQLLHDCCALINETPVLVLQKLNSPDIAKSGVNNKPLCLHQEYATTMVSYSGPVIVLVAMLLRRTDEYVITLPLEIEDKVVRVREALDEDEETGKEAIFELLLALWTSEWLPTPSRRVVDPTIHSLMLSCLRDDGSFLEPVLFTNVIARLEYGMRCIFLRAMHMHGDLTDVAKRLERWYQEKVESTFNTLRDLQHLLSSVAFNTISLPRVVWTDDQSHSEMRYCGAPITITNIADMFSEMEKDAVKMWEEKVLLGLDLRVEYDHVYDDLTNTTSGYSFLTDHRNPAFHNKHLLLKAIYDNEDLRSEFLIAEKESSMCWNIPRLRQWLADYARLQRLELILAHCTAGSPSRGTEITGMLYSNTPTSSGRNLAFVADTLTLLCTYQKTSSTRGQSKLIPHALSGFSGDLLVQDLAIARPFAEFVAYIVFGDNTELLNFYRIHLFVNNGELFTTPDITSALEQYTLSWLGEKLGVNALRHIFSAFRRKLCNRMEELFAEDNMDTIGAIQMGHSRSTENRVYGLEANGLGGAPEDLLRLFLEASSDWQVVLSLVPGGLKLRYRDAMAVHFQSLVEAQRIRLRLPPLKSLQSEISTVVESMFDRMWLRISQELEARLPLSSSQSSHTLTVGEGSTQEFQEHPKPAPVEDEHAPTISLEGQALVILRGLLGDPDAQWSSNDQKTAVLTMLMRKEDLVALLPTGSGKSMIALIPALMETNTTTVLVCPLISLMTDYRRRFDGLRVPYQVYDGGPLRGPANLVIVSADSIKLPDWRHHLSNLHDKRPVARFVFDEAHIPLTDVSYRRTLSNIYEMRAFLPVQVGLLSGSIPVHAESLLRKTFGLTEDCVLLRASCNRPEIQYVWKPPYAYNQFVPAVVTAAESFIFLADDDRGLIYVTSFEVGTILSTKLHVPFYTSNHSVSPQERLTMYNDWVSGKVRFMVCTTAFGAGNDYPNVRVVIHAGTPHEMIPYLQETGRAGRDGKPALCIMFPGSLRFLAKVDADIDISGAHAMINAMRTSPNSCIRAKLTSFIDGVPTCCTSDDANQLCSSCEQEVMSTSVSSGTKRTLDNFETAADDAKRRKLNRQQSENEYSHKLKEALVFWSRHCIFCQVSGDFTCSSHDIIGCPTLQSLVLEGQNDSVRAYRDFKGSVQYPKPPTGQHIVICYKCAVPRGMPIDVHPNRFSKGSGGCTYPDIIPPLAFAIYHHEDLRWNASRYFGHKFSDMDTFTRWLATPSSPHPSNIVALFLWYHEHYSQLA